MSTDMPQRGVLTDLLAAHLDGHELFTERTIKFGDARVNAEGGWQGDQPGRGTYLATVTLHTGPASALPAMRETVRAQHTSWSCTYRIKSIGGTRSQADNTADRARKAVLSFDPAVVDMDGVSWSILKIVFPTMAPVVPEGQLDALTFSVEDTFEVWVTRARA